MWECVWGVGLGPRLKVKAGVGVGLRRRRRGGVRRRRRGRSRRLTCGGGSMSFCRFWMAIRSFCLLSATTWMENKAGMAGQSEAICPLGEGWPRLEASLSLIWRWRGVLEGEVA